MTVGRDQAGGVLGAKPQSRRPQMLRFATRALEDTAGADIRRKRDATGRSRRFCKATSCLFSTAQAATRRPTADRPRHATPRANIVSNGATCPRRACNVRRVPDPSLPLTMTAMMLAESHSVDRPVSSKTLLRVVNMLGQASGKRNMLHALGRAAQALECSTAIAKINRSGIATQTKAPANRFAGGTWVAER